MLCYIDCTLSHTYLFIYCSTKILAKILPILEELSYYY